MLKSMGTEASSDPDSFTQVILSLISHIVHVCSRPSSWDTMFFSQSMLLSDNFDSVLLKTHFCLCDCVFPPMALRVHWIQPAICFYHVEIQVLLLSPARDSHELVRTIRCRLYLKDVEGRGPEPRRCGGAIPALHRQGRESSRYKMKCQSNKRCQASPWSSVYIAQSWAHKILTDWLLT
jgi:hypothetical protein